MNCGDCGVPVGSFHKTGCDVERCPRCGGQAISCHCIYEICGYDPNLLEIEHPEIYEGGPTDEMCERWDREWGHRRIPWTGDWPGAAECREYGLYAKFTDHGWQKCGPDDDGATEDLNTLMVTAHWDADQQKWVMPP